MDKGNDWETTHFNCAEEVDETAGSINTGTNVTMRDDLEVEWEQEEDTTKRDLE